jgi:hypothetical protein
LLCPIDLACLSLWKPKYNYLTSELFALNRLGLVTLQYANRNEAERLLTEGHTRAAAVGNRERVTTALINLGNVAGLRKDWAAAR